MPLTGTALDLPLRATPDKVNAKLKELDGILDKRNAYMAARQLMLDSLTANVGPSSADSASTYLNIARSAMTYSIEQSIKYLELGLDVTERSSLSDLSIECKLTLASIYPSNGFITEALLTFNSIDPENIPERLQSDYYISGESMYESILQYYTNTDVDTEYYKSKCSEFRKNAMKYFPPESPEWLLREAKQYVAGGNQHVAQVSLYDLIHDLDDTHPVYVESTRLMAECADSTGLEHDLIYYLAASAIGEIKRGDREGIALHLTGQHLYEYGDFDRAHSYLTKAIESIPAAGAQSPRNEALMRSLIAMDDSYGAKMNNNIRLLIGLIFVLVLGVVIISINLHKHKQIVNQLSRERHLVIEANNARSTFLQNFLELGVVSTQRLLSFRKLVNRKIASKQYSDLYDLSKSSKVIDEQRKQFMTIFDASLLSVYPTFVDEINNLLRPEERYELQDTHLPSELRVMALVRLGIDDVNKIAEALTFSASTVYAYKAKVRSKAKNKDTFDADVMNIGSTPPFPA